MGPCYCYDFSWCSSRTRGAGPPPRDGRHSRCNWSASRSESPPSSSSGFDGSLAVVADHTSGTEPEHGYLSSLCDDRPARGISAHGSPFDTGYSSRTRRMTSDWTGSSDPKKVDGRESSVSSLETLRVVSSRQMSRSQRFRCRPSRSQWFRCQPFRFLPSRCQPIPPYQRPFRAESGNLPRPVERSA